MDLFEDIVEVHGIPNRVRGDHGTENLLVRAFMEAVKGSDRGSYILGRYVPFHQSALTLITFWNSQVCSQHPYRASLARFDTWIWW